MRPSPRSLASAALLLAIAVALRCPDWGNPVIHVDEQYYLLVADRMWTGAVPYVDVWDRKPIGLFLLYAGFHLLPGDGILAYQIAATVAAAATALLVRTGARILGTRPPGALAAAILYLLLLSVLGGRGGQAPVFYNLPVAAAGVLALSLPGRTPRGIWWSGAAACLLAGIAIQIKYTPAVEGAFVGLAHLWALIRRGTGPARLAGAVALWLLLGLAPTLAAIGWYLGQGQFAAFWFANVTSIGLRPGYPVAEWGMRLLGIAVQLSPLLACAALAWRGRPRAGDPARRYRLAAGWLVAAVLGFAAIGTFFDHYALPLLAPLLVAAAPVLGRSRPALAGTVAVAAMLFAVERAGVRDDGPGARRVAAIVRANSGEACPWVFIGDTVTYLLADACLPTPYAFPNLLAYTTERGATGIDEAAEVRRILAARPPVIVTSDRRLTIWNPDSLAAVRRALARDYRPIYAAPRDRWRTLVYLRRDRPVRRAAPR